MNLPSPFPGRFRNGESRAGFTLLELLATISVISVLAVMLMSAVGGVRNKAKSAQCLSNLNQIRIASQLYSQDNDGLTPPPYFTGMLKPYLEVGQSSVAENPRSVWLCPADARPNKDTGSGATSYAYNAEIAGWPVEGYYEKSKTRWNAINEAPKKIMFLDADAFYCNAFNHTAAFRHSNALNAVFFDGHIETLKFTDPNQIYNQSYWSN